jgi:hypothetical protein
VVRYLREGLSKLQRAIGEVEETVTKTPLSRCLPHANVGEMKGFSEERPLSMGPQKRRLDFWGIGAPAQARFRRDRLGGRSRFFKTSALGLLLSFWLQGEAPSRAEDPSAAAATSAFDTGGEALAPIQVQAAPARGPSRGPAQEQVPIRKALEDTVSRLGGFSEEQLKLFREDLLPRGKSFVSSVHSGAEGKVRVDVDLAAVRNFLGLVFPTEVMGSGARAPGRKILISLLSAGDCASCLEVEKPLLRALAERLGRRGFGVETLDSDETPRAALSFAWLRERASEAGAAGALGIRMGRKNLDSVDTAHLEDQGYSLEFLWSFPLLESPVELTEKFETLPGESIREGVDRGLTASLIRLGAFAGRILGKAQVAGSGSGVSSSAHLTLRLEGAQNYGDYVAIRDQLVEWGKGEVVLRERRFENGKSWWTVSFVALASTGESTPDLTALGEALALKYRKKAVKSGNPLGLQTKWDEKGREVEVRAHAESPSSLESRGGGESTELQEDSDPTRKTSVPDQQESKVRSRSASGGKKDGT